MMLYVYNIDTPNYFSDKIIDTIYFKRMPFTQIGTHFSEEEGGKGWRGGEGKGRKKGGRLLDGQGV